ncbi:MAG: hypothetical protein QM486_04825 [Flavobacteriaceae bacterium]
MKLESYTYNKFDEFEEVFFKKLSESSFEPLLSYKNKLKKLISLSTLKIFKKDADVNFNQELFNYIIKENNAEKNYYGQEISNSLEQVLASLNFYLDALILKSEREDFLKSEREDSIFLKEIKKLTNDALFVTKEIANDLMYNQLSNKSLFSSLQNLISTLSFNKSTKINLTKDINFNESKLSITKKHQIYNGLKIVLRQVLKSNSKEGINIKIGYSYGTLVKIEINQKRLYSKYKNLDKNLLHGYNNLKHRLAILGFVLQQKNDENLKIILKAPIISKIKYKDVV